MLGVMIADDDVIFREYLRKCVDWAEVGMTLLGEVENGQQALELARIIQPQILIMDIRMPLMDGLQSAEQIKLLLPRSEIVMLSSYAEFSYAQHALEIGVCSFLLKPCELAEITSALRKAANRLSAFPTSELAEKRYPGAGKHVRRAIDLIEEHYVDADFSVAGLAKMMYLHEGYLRRIFKSDCNTTPCAVLKETRMRMAEKRLREYNEQVQEVSQKVGFTDAAYFSRCFKRFFGYAPSQS